MTPTERANQIGPIVLLALGGAGLIVVPAAGLVVEEALDGFICVVSWGLACSGSAPDHTWLHWSLGIGAAVAASGLLWLAIAAATSQPVGDDALQLRGGFDPQTRTATIGVAGRF